MITVIGPKDKRRKDAINTTSRSNDFGRGLSPFILGPIKLYNHPFQDKFFTAKNVENAWQFSKVYPGQTNAKGNPSSVWWRWAIDGWNSSFAQRYPMGKGVKPLYSYWAGEKLPYIEARKKIYIPCYVQGVLKSPAWDRLCDIYFDSCAGAEHSLYLWDFDGYDHRAANMSYWDVIHNENRSLGHAFVLAMLLEGYIDEKGQITRKCEEEQDKKIRSA